MPVDQGAKTYAAAFMATFGPGHPTWAVDLRDGERWVELHGCPSKPVAKALLDDLVDKGFERSRLRVRRLPEDLP